MGKLTIRIVAPEPERSTQLEAEGDLEFLSEMALPTLSQSAGFLCSTRGLGLSPEMLGNVLHEIRETQAMLRLGKGYAGEFVTVTL